MKARNERREERSRQRARRVDSLALWRRDAATDALARRAGPHARVATFADAATGRTLTIATAHVLARGVANADDRLKHTGDEYRLHMQVCSRLAAIFHRRSRRSGLVAGLWNRPNTRRDSRPDDTI